MKTIKKLVAMLCICTMCISLGVIPSFAMEKAPESETKVSTVEITRSTTNNFIYPDDTSVYINGNPTRVTYTSQMTGIFAKKGNIVLTFTGRNYNNKYSMVFYCDGSTRSSNIGFSFVTDTYDITLASSDASVSSIIVSLY